MRGRKPKSKVRTKPVVLPPVPSALQPTLHARWVRCLLIKGYANADVRQLLENDDLPCPGDDELDSIRGGSLPPKPFKPGVKGHAASVAYLEKMEIGPFFDPDNQEAPQALHLLRSPRARELTEAAILTNVPVEAVVQVLDRQLHHQVSAEAIQLYYGTFFDIGGVSRAQLRVLVQSRVRQAVMRTVSGDEDQGAARRAIGNDPRMVAVTLPASGGAWGAVLLALGMMPPRRDLVVVAGELEQLAAIRANQALMRGGRDDERKAEAFVGVIQRVRQIRESVGEPTDGLVTAMRFHIQRDTTVIPTVGELREKGEGVTVEIQPIMPDEVVDMEGTAR